MLDHKDFKIIESIHDDLRRLVHVHEDLLRLFRKMHKEEEIEESEKNPPVMMFINWTLSTITQSNQLNQGETNIMAVNDVTLNLVAPFGNNLGTPVELLADGTTKFAYDPTKIAWAVQDPTVASFVQNADGSATFTPLKAGATGVAVSDSATTLSAQGVLTVTAGTTGQPTTMNISWSAAVPGASPVKK
jgi:hypothetical protein